MKEKNKKKLWLIIWIVLGTLLISFLFAFKWINWIKYIVGILFGVSSIFLIIWQVGKLKQFKKDVESEMPAFFVQLYNAGVITKEQCLNPTEQERNLFLNEYSKDIRKRKAFIFFTAIIGLYLVILFATI